MDLYFGETASSLRRDSYKTPPSSSFLATTKLSCREGSWCTIHAESNYSYFLCTTFINVQTMKCLSAAGITAYDMIMRAQKPQLANAFSPDPPGGFRPYPRVYSGNSPLWSPPLRYGSESGSAGFKWLRRGVEGGGYSSPLPNSSPFSTTWALNTVRYGALSAQG